MVTASTFSGTADRSVRQSVGPQPYRPEATLLEYSVDVKPGVRGGCYNGNVCPGVDRRCIVKRHRVGTRRQVDISSDRIRIALR